GHHLPAEFSALPHVRGALSMARGPDPDSAGSQFFVVHAEHAAFLDGQYSVFGHLKEGLDVLDAIASVEVDFGAGGERGKPLQRVGLRAVAVRAAAPAAPVPAAAAAAAIDVAAADGAGDDAAGGEA